MSSLQKLQLVKFAPRNGVGFFDTLKQRIDEYFTTNNLQMTGNSSMKLKSVAIVSMYLLPYILLIAGVGSLHLFLFYGLWILMGVGMVGIGCSIMHDSNHDSYSANKGLNKYLSKIIILVGGYDVNWRLQHNVLHHTYTNIEGLDHDIDAGILLRFSPHAERRRFHRFQHIYAWFLYGLLTFQWATIKDFRQVMQYEKLGLLKKEKLTLNKALLQVVLYKVFYYSYVIVLPILFSGVAWYHVLIGFVAMHFLAGLALSCIFQLAHVMEDCEFPAPNDSNKMNNNWAVHQMLNTANFAPKSKIMAWFIGGLNRQVEHHLFPYICHVHYKHIAGIVKDTAKEYGVPYYEKPTLLAALIDHGRMLKKLGRS
ncbi:MAG TPA: acyl-CoA desaturase [Flavipsychrobacter sp.]|nr:acyl-CoA desaturase [Flavipsychrobacter sp.]